MSSEETATEDAWAADKAREAAEARRKRILEAANARMGLVEGTYSSKGANAAAATTTTDEEGETPKDDAVSTTTTSAKLAAMRRRRFKKATPAATVEVLSTTTATTDGKEVAPDEQKEEASKEEATAKTALDAATSAAETKAEKSHIKDGSDHETAVVLDERQADVTEEVKTETKKKYVGVAKMRRRMIKERQQNQDQEGAMFTTTDTSIADAAAAKLKKKKRPIVATLPILMHAVTVLLLFLAGLDVGLQQGAIGYYDGALLPLRVHSELAPRKLGGLQRILSYAAIGGLIPSEDAVTAKAKPSIAEPEWQAVVEQEDDEFADLAKDDAKKPDNLDPLFQVDLDKLTDGTGLYFLVARFAVRMHRFNLAIFYYGPRAFFRSLAALLLSLTQSPPILCLTAILLRQVVGKFILGSKLPAKIEDEAQHKDVLSMVKNFLSSFLLASFPTAATLYDVWSHLRSDMYVLLCGLFVGLAWSHNSRAGSPYGLDDAPVVGADTTTTTTTTVPVVVDGIADEL